MEVSIRITNEAEISKFAFLLANMYPTEGQTKVSEKPETVTATKVVAHIKQRKPTAKAVSAQLEKSASAETEVETSSDAVSTNIVTLEQLRALATAKIQADKANGPKVKALVESLGAHAISSLAEDKREEFMNLVSEL